MRQIINLYKESKSASETPPGGNRGIHIIIKAIKGKASRKP